MGDWVHGIGNCISVIIVTIRLLSNELSLIALRAGHVLSGKKPDLCNRLGATLRLKPQSWR